MPITRAYKTSGILGGATTNGDTLVADSSQTTGLRYNPQNALANVFINGGMDCWQRGTSFTPAAGTLTYTTDRFQTYRASTGYTVSRQTVNDSTNLPNIQFALRSQRDSGNTSANIIYLSQSVETANAIPYAGKTVTLSFYARAGANFSAASSIMNVDLRAGTGTDENVNSGYTGGSTPISSTVTLTTTWQRFAVTGTVGATVKEFAFYSYWTPVGTAGANDWIEITGIQLDLGTYTASSAPTFRRSGGTLAGEFAAACRYYFRVTPGSNSLFGNGISYNTTSSLISIPYPVPMRIRPTALEQTGTATDYKTLRANAAAFDNCTAVPTFDGGTSANVAFVAVTSANVVSGDAALLFSGSAGSYLGWSAEL